MTDAVRPRRNTIVRLVRGPQKLRWISATLIAVAVSLSTVTVSPRPASASLTSDKARAAALYQQVQNLSRHVGFLSQKFDEAHLKYVGIITTIRNTRAIVASIESKVSQDNVQLRQAAVYAYVTSGNAQASNPLFGGNAATSQAASIYATVASGNISAIINRLTTNKIELTQERSLLTAQVHAASVAANTARNALRQAESTQNAVNEALAQVKGQITAYYNAQAAAAAAAASHLLSASSRTPTGAAPPPNPLGEAAVQAAESFIGTWYCWGGASRSCVDCSGLVMLAYDAVGISFPHYSGAMYEETQRVPLWDIQPGDLIFYGYDGDEHVAMYVGNGDMIEAEMTGTQVHIVPIRLGYGFAGIGRP